MKYANPLSVEEELTLRELMRNSKTAGKRMRFYSVQRENQLMKLPLSTLCIEYLWLRE